MNANGPLRITALPYLLRLVKLKFERALWSLLLILYFHLQEIYDLFCALDENEYGYVLEVSRSTTRLFDHMASLLAHPLQRPRQRDSQYKLIEMNKADTVET